MKLAIAGLLFCFSALAQAQVVQDGYLTSTGSKVHYRVVYGLVPQDTVLLHGNLASNTWWQPFVNELSRRSKGPPALAGRLVMIEWRGFGQSAPPQSVAELSPVVLGNDVVEICRQLGVVKADLIGHSTGGLIGLYAVQQEPSLFNRIVLLDSVGPDGLAPALESAFAPLFEALLQAQRDGNRAFVSDVMASTILGVDRSSAVFQRIVSDVMNSAPLNIKGVSTQLFALGAGKVPKLGIIAQPTLILHGDQDKILAKESNAVPLFDMMINAEFQIVPGAGHSLNVEDPVRFANYATKFLYQ